MSDARTFWDGEIFERTHIEWMAHPLVGEYMHTLVGGPVPRWPLEWFRDWVDGRKFERSLSIGCGTGRLERSLIQDVHLCDRIDAFDGSVGSLCLARRLADEAGLGDRIRYFAADFNEPALPRRTWDAVFFHQSAHHVGKLEKLFKAVLLAMKPDGLLYLDEYVGPSRTDWNAELLREQRAEYAKIDRSLRLLDELPLPIQEDDPSEALRSGEIEEQLRVGFDIVERKPYGGTLLSVILPALHLARVPDSLVQHLIDRERELLAAGMPSYYAAIVARPKRVVRKAMARARYFAEPKAKRIWIETRRKIVGW